MKVNWTRIISKLPPADTLVWLLYPPSGMVVKGKMSIVDNEPAYLSKYKTSRKPLFWAEILPGKE